MELTTPSFRAGDIGQILDSETQPVGLPYVFVRNTGLQCLFYCRYHAWSLGRFKRRRKARSGSVPRSPTSFEGVGRSIMNLSPLACPRRTNLSLAVCLVLAAGVTM